MQPIQIFRPGRHTAMDGRSITFAEADLAAAAAAYDPALHEAPIVVGHSGGDAAPAYGWIASLSTGEGGALEAAPRQVDPAFAEIVRAGRYKKVSASFYTPDSPHNPRPGGYYLRHVAFLGAEAPAVKGLRPVSFADHGEGVVEFADGWQMGMVARAFRRMRDLFITKFGQEVADQALPTWEIDSLAEAAVAEQVAAPSPAPSYSEQNRETKVAQPTAEEAARAAELERREAELRTREASFAERDRTQRMVANAAWFDALVRDGRALPAHRGLTLAFMERLDAAEAVSFGEGEPRTELAAFQALLAGYPKLVQFGEFAPRDPSGGDGLAGEGADVDAIIAASIAFQEEQRGRGIVVSNVDAIAHVTRRIER